MYWYWKSLSSLLVSSYLVSEVLSTSHIYSLIWPSVLSSGLQRNQNVPTPCCVRMALGIKQTTNLRILDYPGPLFIQCMQTPVTNIFQKLQAYLTPSCTDWICLVRRLCSIYSLSHWLQAYLTPSCTDRIWRVKWFCSEYCLSHWLQS